MGNFALATISQVDGQTKAPSPKVWKSGPPNWKRKTQWYGGGKFNFKSAQRIVGGGAVISSIQEENVQLKVPEIPPVSPAKVCRSCKNAGRDYEHNSTT